MAVFGLQSSGAPVFRACTGASLVAAGATPSGGFPARCGLLSCALRARDLGAREPIQRGWVSQPTNALHPPVLLTFCVTSLRNSRGARPRGHAITAQRAGEPAWHRRQRRRRATARVLVRLGAAAGLLQGHHSAQRGAGLAPSAMPAPHAAADRGARVSGGRGGELSLQARFDRLENLFFALQRGGSAAAITGGAPPPSAGRDQQRGAGGGGAAGSNFRGGGGQRGTSGRTNGGHRGGRPGDWVCLQCGAQPCFARAPRCFRCGAPRNGALAIGSARAERDGDRDGGLAGATVRAAYLGPVGAGGSRPLLGRRSDASTNARTDGTGPTMRANECPTVRVPSASVAARATTRATDGLQGPQPQGHQGQPPSPPQTDADGFQEVQRRGGVRSWAAVAAAATTPCAGPPAVGVKNSWEALDDAMDTSEGGPGRRDAAGGDGDHGDDAGPADRADDEGGSDDAAHHDARRDAAGEDADAGHLRQLWDESCAAVRRLERDAQGFPPELVEAAKAQRDAAERRWRSARRPHPLHKRLRWAEADLREAEAKQKAHQEELEIHLERTERRTHELRERLQVDEARTAKKRQALLALQREGALHLAQGSERAARVAIDGLGADIVPALGAIIRQLGDADEPVRRDLQLVAQSLSRVEGILRSGAEHDLASRGPTCFNIAEDDAGGATEADGGDGGDKARENDGGFTETAYTESPQNMPKGTRWTKPAEHAPWRKEMGTTSAEAVEDARRRVRARTQGNQTADKCKGDMQGGENGSHDALAADLGGAGADPSRTNDLAEAARREQAAAHLQIQRVHLQHQALADPQRQQEEEAKRMQRAQSQQDELRKHQMAFEQAAAARAAEEERQRAELLARLTPEELAQAAQLHARNEAIGAQVFGTPAASHLAGLVQQSHDLAQAQAQGHQQPHQQGARADGANTDTDARAEVDQLMAMSAEDYAAWNGQHHGL